MSLSLVVTSFQNGHVPGCSVTLDMAARGNVFTSLAFEDKTGSMAEGKRSCNSSAQFLRLLHRALPLRCVFSRRARRRGARVCLREFRSSCSSPSALSLHQRYFAASCARRNRLSLCARLHQIDYLTRTVQRVVKLDVDSLAVIAATKTFVATASEDPTLRFSSSSEIRRALEQCNADLE